jgi:hypothetical protein
MPMRPRFAAIVVTVMVAASIVRGLTQCTSSRSAARAKLRALTTCSAITSRPPVDRVTRGMWAASVERALGNGAPNVGFQQLVQSLSLLT